ncbi:TonB-dependent receptor plug domain-containing protein, partial [Methylacidimicrobium cyclopophantes]|uniref:TonB-dependent receptor plug domain-containing protein n=1 Tax=Methylacidimicrobium cyclopophantes TaxID=1041766 RepID=UPI001FED04BC
MTSYRASGLFAEESVTHLFCAKFSRGVRTVPQPWCKWILLRGGHSFRHLEEPDGRLGRSEHWHGPCWAFCAMTLRDHRGFLLFSLVILFLLSSFALPQAHPNPLGDPPAGSSGASNEPAPPQEPSPSERKLRSALRQPKDATKEQSELERAMTQMPEVQVVATTPLPGMGQPLENLPGDYQVAQGKTWVNQQEFASQLFLERNQASVNYTDLNGNPFLSSISYRGFAASPIAGQPIGISVFYDGVRVNEPFSNNVQWDFIPQMAVQSMEIVPGSNPIYGQNTLGGAIVIQTKDGRTSPGSLIQSYMGSWGTEAVGFQYGGYKGHWDWFLSGNWFSMEGWRQQSSSYVKQLFGKIGYHNEETGTDVHLSYTGADNLINTLGPTPLSMLEQSYTMIYTGPNPQTDNLNLVNLIATQKLNEDWTLGGNAYFRQSNEAYNNGNIANNVDQFLGFDYPLDAQAIIGYGPGQSPLFGPAGMWQFGSVDQTGA